MTTIVTIWVVGAIVLAAVSACALVADALTPVPPRRALTRFLWRLLIAIWWPMALPVYLVIAWRRDLW